MSQKLVSSTYASNLRPTLCQNQAISSGPRLHNRRTLVINFSHLCQITLVANFAPLVLYVVYGTNSPAEAQYRTDEVKPIHTFIVAQ